MPDWGRMARRIAGLPEPERNQPQQPQGGGWADAAQRLKETEQATATREAQAGQMPWTVQEERSAARFARGFGRGLLWLAVGLAALTGIREWVYPNDDDSPAVTAPADDGPDFPTDDAQAVAGRFTRAYLSWDEENPEQRAALLAPDLPAGADTDAGWDGAGRQQVLAVQPGQVSITSDTTARVQVTALVQSAPPQAGEEAAVPVQRWMSLEVPVTVAGGRVVVSGSPGLVGVPESGPRITAPATPDADLALSNDTREVVTDFFAAYAAGDISAELAPGSTLPALPTGTGFEAVQSWSVDDGSGDARTGTAVVIWRVADAQLTQTYRVELTRVTASGGQRWQVADIHGGQA